MFSPRRPTPLSPRPFSVSPHGLLVWLTARSSARRTHRPLEGTTAAARLIVCGCEHTANNRTDAEHAEEVH